jgi:hypothetical protein
VFDDLYGQPIEAGGEGGKKVGAGRVELDSRGYVKCRTRMI